MPSRPLRIVLIAWVAFMPLLCGGALVKRERDYRHLRRQLVAKMAPIAETGSTPVDEYIWGGQGQTIHSLNLGYGSPELQRSLLLCEARRCYDWKYLYTSVNNYDLRTRLIAHCTRDFPNDPKVHWAAGQLALAAGDYELAERELGTTVNFFASDAVTVTSSVDLLLWHPNGQPATGLRGFCQQTGISEEHLRGRYACALTLMGKWDEADVQAKLAELANDGVEPPAPEEPWDNVWMEQNQPEQWAAFKREELNSDTAVKEYVKSHDPRHLQDLLKTTDTSDPVPDSDWVDQGRFNLLRAYLLTHEWEAAARFLVSEDDDDHYYFRHSLRQDAGTLLTNLAAGKPLGRTASANRDQVLKELKAQHPDQSPEDWEWELRYANAGSLSGLLEADYLPFLLRTDMFADALQRSGRPLDDVLAEVRAVTQPECENYYDFSNGGLRWR